ncbi:MAG: ATP-binding protein, partial [Telluria sp.]
HVTMPSMMLLTLVENAIKHGIEPSLRGGQISVAAAVRGTSVVLTVTDTGPGLGSAPGAGEGLANVRARLTLLYGDAASLSVTDGDAAGVEATITLPLNKEKI